ncbi:MAG: extracellular solute-binding protein [Chloroflexi bacterium]|nr:extracellular solute-binding protein [Chloroflexota bacterium]
MKKVFCFCVLVIAAFFLATGCAPEAASPPSSARPPEKASLAEKPSWQQEWNKTLAEARAEGTIVLYGSTPPAILKERATNLFREKFGLSLETLSAKGGELRVKIESERRMGIYYPDILIGGAPTNYDIKGWGFTDPIEPALLLPEVTDSSKWYGGKLPWSDEKKMAFLFFASPDPPLAINTDMVRRGEIKSYKDLLAPRWKGKIVMNDPTSDGAGLLMFAQTQLHNLVDADYFRRLARDQEVTLSRDKRLQVEWVAKGKYPVLLFASPNDVAPFVQAGAPIAPTSVEEGTILSETSNALSLMNKAPHPSAARVFINWFLGKEGQQLIQDATDKQVQRTDISTDKLTGGVRQPGEKYLPDPLKIEKVYLEEYPKYADMARQIFGPLSR